ncbi:cyclic nucleotide-gated ion channel, partial [Musa troglodytarum]
VPHCITMRASHMPFSHGNTCPCIAATATRVAEPKTPFVLFGFFLSSNDAICCCYIYLGLRLSTIHPATLPASTISSATVMAGEGSSMPSHDEETVASAFGAASGGRRRNPSSDRQAKWLHEWDRVFLLMCAAGLVVDPLFFYALSISSTCMCLFVDGWFAVTVTALRCMTDAVHLLNMCLQLAMAYDATPRSSVEEKDASAGRAMAHGQSYLRAKTGFLLDLFIILRCLRLRLLPDGGHLLQVVLWVVAPAMLCQGMTSTVMTVFLISFLSQYLPKVCHSVCFLRRLQNSLGYIFGNIWGGIALNLIAYFVASHAAGACWYLLGIQRATECLKQQCVATDGCRNRTVACVDPMYYGTARAAMDGERLAWAKNLHVRSMCVDSSDNFEYGSYKWIVNLVTNPNRLEKVLFPIFWGLMTLSLHYMCSTVCFGIQHFRDDREHNRVGGDHLQHHHRYQRPALGYDIDREHQGLLARDNVEGAGAALQDAELGSVDATQELTVWDPAKGAAVRAAEMGRDERVDEFEMARRLPDGMRRDIKYHLCLDLVRQVPLFQHMDELVLENICDRVKSLLIPGRNRDPVPRMLFVVRGHLQSSQVLRDGVKSYCMLGPGNFSGDELLSWCLIRQFVERLPPSSSTLVAAESTEAFGLDADDLKYVTEHFRYTFASERVKRSARYYSPGWRTWAAVAIQLAWWRYKHRLTLTSLSFIRPRRPPSRCSSMEEDKLRLYTALLTSPKPNQDDFTA